MSQVQKFKGYQLELKECVNNIIAVYEASEKEGQFWYTTANLFALHLSETYSCSHLQAAGIIAALSPQKSWKENKKLANDFLRTGKAGHTGVMIQKCKDILKASTVEDVAAILNGHKITSFFINIYCPEQRQVVTIDRHAQDIAFGRVLDVSRSMTAAQYQFFVNCYLIAANKLGIAGHELQAVTWVYWRQTK